MSTTTLDLNLHLKIALMMHNFLSILLSSRLATGMVNVQVIITWKEIWVKTFSKDLALAFSLIAFYSQLCALCFFMEGNYMYQNSISPYISCDTWSFNSVIKRTDLFPSLHRFFWGISTKALSKLMSIFSLIFF